MGLLLLLGEFQVSPSPPNLKLLPRPPRAGGLEDDSGVKRPVGFTDSTASQAVAGWPSQILIPAAGKLTLQWQQ